MTSRERKLRIENHPDKWGGDHSRMEAVFAALKPRSNKKRDVNHCRICGVACKGKSCIAHMRTRKAVVLVLFMVSTLWCNAQRGTGANPAATTTQPISVFSLVVVAPKQTYFTWDTQPAGTSNKVSWGTVRGFWTNGNTTITTNVFPYTNGSVYKVIGILAGVESQAVALWPSNRYDRIWIQTSTNLTNWKDAYIWTTNYNLPQEFLRHRAELIKWE
jgi:hypothetical protein